MPEMAVSFSYTRLQDELGDCGVPPRRGRQICTCGKQRPMFALRHEASALLFLVHASRFAFLMRSFFVPVRQVAVEQS